MKSSNFVTGKVVVNSNNNLKEILNGILQITKRIGTAILANDIQSLKQRVQIRESLIKNELNKVLEEDSNFSIDIKNLFNDIQNLNIENIELLKRWKNRVSRSLVSIFEAKNLVKYHYSYKMKEKFQ